MNKLLKCLLTISTLFIFSCMHNDADNNILGIYKVTDRACNGSGFEVDACKSIVFIEFVKGSFYKIADNEVDFVIWSEGNSTDLLYQAKKYEGKINFEDGQLKALISEDGVKEEVIFSSALIGSYVIEKPVSSSNQSTRSELKLMRASEDDLKGFVMEYPGSD